MNETKSTEKPKVRYPRALALEVAREMVRALEPYCERIVVAGSLRRRKAMVGDVEIVFIPKMVEQKGNMFFTWESAATDEVLDRMLESGVTKERPSVTGTIAWGLKNKLAIHCASGIPVDLFTTTEAAWWSYLVCRTGGSQNNIAICMAAKAKGWQWKPYEGFKDSEGNLIRAESEQDVFRLVGLEYKEPWMRI